MARKVMSLALIGCLLAVGASACGSSGKRSSGVAAHPPRYGPLEACLRRHGYNIAAEPPEVRRTAPRTFEFVAVWNLLDPNRIALAMTISRSTAGAARAAAWTRRTNARIGKGVVRAPVVQFGRINVLWTAAPGPSDRKAVYGCLRSTS